MNITPLKISEQMIVRKKQVKRDSLRRPLIELRPIRRSEQARIKFALLNPTGGLTPATKRGAVKL